MLTKLLTMTTTHKFPSLGWEGQEGVAEGGQGHQQEQDGGALHIAQTRLPLTGPQSLIVLIVKENDKET